MTLGSKVIAALERLGRVLRSVLLADALGEDISITQAQILLQCYLQPGRLYSVTELAEELDLTQPTISDSVTSLQRKGLLQKLQREDDRRAVAVVLTAKGRATAHRLWQRQVRRFEKVLSHLSANQEVQLLHLLLQTIAAAYAEGVLRSARTCLTCRFLRRLSTEHRERQPAYFCSFLEIPLDIPDLRILCPDHEPREEERVN
ncbi:MAG: MarR family winged helix-turn-helix transcriptional regulator [Candidatus Kapabacteria bacterium]|nr:MarR family winged helix-turn-helix transcriptional regulator [Candidatus Kapabacteria bacterium]